VLGKYYEFYHGLCAHRGISFRKFGCMSKKIVFSPGFEKHGCLDPDVLMEEGANFLKMEDWSACLKMW